MTLFRSWLARVAAQSLFLGSGVACSGSASNTPTGPEAPPTPNPVATVSVSPSNVTLGIGVAQQLTATTRDAAGAVLTGRVVTWATSDQAKASVQGNGVVTAMAAGSATITATSEGRSGTAAFVVSAGPALPPFQIFTSRTAWTAALATYGLAAATLTGVGPSFVTAKDTDYGAFRIVVDSVSATAGYNPGYAPGFFRFSMKDPFFPIDGPKWNRIVFAQTVRAFSGDFAGVGNGVVIPAGATTGGWVTMSVGSTDVVISDLVNAAGDGFIGLITATPVPDLTFTYRSKPSSASARILSGGAGFFASGVLRAP